MTRVKICGITNPEDALVAIQFGAHALGFVFAESPRRITPGEAKAIIAQIPPLVTTVGVFVDEAPEKVWEIALECRLNALQFHGFESPEYCREFDRTVIKAFRVKDRSVEREMARFNVDGYLLDSWQGGGTGRGFDWDVIGVMKARIILAGGLTPENVSEAIQKIHPYAVDVSSGVERSPGKKDHQKMEAFIRHVRQCEG